MADHFLPGLENFSHSFSSSDSDPINSEFINHFSAMNPIHQHPSVLNFHGLIEHPFDNLLLSESTRNSETFPGLFIHEDKSFLPHDIISNDNNHGGKKRKAKVEIGTPANSPANSSPQVSDNGVRRKNGAGRGKRVKGNGKNEEKPTEVVHVRAKRGQATDSHSLAERVRREKINERLRCLQDIVPGCYKTMGMAVMLDEIINYVQSLQNQVEFLSMKITAASTFHDFNSEADALVTMQKAKEIEALKIENEVNPGFPYAQFTSSDISFGCYPQFPHSR